MPRDNPDNESENDTSTRNKKNAEPELLGHLSYEELLQKFEETEQKSNEHWERILRMQADSENAQRRLERDVSNAHKYALEKFATDLLPIVDSLELCVTSVPENMKKSAESIIEGVNLTLKMFYTSFEKFGIKQVNPVNQAFDPEFEQAIAVEYNPKVKPGTVLSVLQKGYTLNNRLLRPALVVVAKAEE